MGQLQTGGQALVEALVRHGVEAVFTLPGVQLDYAMDALYAVRDRIRVIHTRHEQTAAYMADGYARASGRVGVCLVVPGPGLLNAGAALAIAYACSSPVLCLVGQVHSQAVGRGYGMLHEIEHQERVLASLTGWSARASSVGQIPRLVDEAFARLSRERPRPVALELPPDILECRAEVTPTHGADPRPADLEASRQAEPDLLPQADPEMLRQAEPDLVRQADPNLLHQPAEPEVSRQTDRELVHQADSETLRRADPEGWRQAAPELSRQAELDSLRQDPDPLPHDPERLRQADAERLRQADPELLRRAAELLRSAARPVIYSGGGTLAAGAWAELQRLAELLEAPVVMSIDGRGALSDRHDLAHTGLSGEALIHEADVVLAVGTRFWQPARVWRLDSSTRVIRIDLDGNELARHGQPAVALHADARAALGGILSLLDGTPKRASRRAELELAKQHATDRLRQFQPEFDYCMAIRAALPDDAILVNDLTHMTFFGTIGMPVYAPRTFIGPGYMGTLGSAFPIALGAQAAFPERTVVALTGDGGFLYALGELATLRQHGLNVITIVFNNNGYGNVRRTQHEVFEDRYLACDLVNPDFPTLGRAFGVATERVRSPAALGAAVRSSVAARAPALIEVALESVSDGVWPLVGRAGGLYPLQPL